MHYKQNHLNGVTTTLMPRLTAYKTHSSFFFREYATMHGYKVVPNWGGHGKQFITSLMQLCG